MNEVKNQMAETPKIKNVSTILSMPLYEKLIVKTIHENLTIRKALSNAVEQYVVSGVN